MSPSKPLYRNEAAPDWTQRTIQLVGNDTYEALRSAHVLVAGLGGVGSMAAEMLARTGVGTITIVDNDIVQPSNINRQVVALHSTVGKQKTAVMQHRLKDINPEIHVRPVNQYINSDTVDGILSEDFNFVVDAIDTLTPKIDFIEQAVKRGYNLTSSMGSGGKTDPSKIGVTDFGKTYNCRLAYILRKKLRKRGIEGGFPVVFSTELTDKRLLAEATGEPNKKSVPGTISFIPVIFGCFLASVVVDQLKKQQ